ncbi:MAG TPA: hypothetical protein VGR95_14785 [Thermoanaerobaculia bacterium]|nr:hypothetical protein [Thermoanaerobaculia bacterium]
MPDRQCQKTVNAERIRQPLACRALTEIIFIQLEQVNFAIVLKESRDVL